MKLVEKMYKVMIKKDGKLLSPYHYTEYEVGRKYVCDNFNADKHKDCARGLYAVGITGLPCAWRNLPGYVVYECAVSGNRVEFDQYNRRYSELTLTREVPRDELYKLALALEPRVGYKLAEVLFPVNPCEVVRESPVGTDVEIALLHDWIKVRRSVSDSVDHSLHNSAQCDVLNSVLICVWNSVHAVMQNAILDHVRNDSMWDSVYDCFIAYFSTLFTSVKKWHGIEHAPGVNPFRPGADLWRAGLVPILDMRTWRLHAGPDMKVEYRTRNY